MTSASTSAQQYDNYIQVKCEEQWAFCTHFMLHRNDALSENILKPFYPEKHYSNLTWNEHETVSQLVIPQP